MTSEIYCTFRVDQHWFGVELSHVQEVIRNQNHTPIPLAHEVVEGLLNLRGNIVTAIDLRRCLGFAERERTATTMHVIISTPAGRISLLVDEIGDVQDVEATRYRPAPGTLSGVAKQLIPGSMTLETKLLLLLDVNKLFLHVSSLVA